MVDESLNAYMYQFIERVCNDVGPRESGTEQELTAGDMVEEELKNIVIQHIKKNMSVVLMLFWEELNMGQSQY